MLQRGRGVTGDGSSEGWSGEEVEGGVTRRNGGGGTAEGGDRAGLLLVFFQCDPSIIYGRAVSDLMEDQGGVFRLA